MGYKWSYRQSAYDLNGDPIILKNGYYTMGMEYEITEETITGNNIFYKMPGFLSESTSQCYALLEDGVHGYMYDEESGESDTEGLIFKFPAKLARNMRQARERAPNLFQLILLLRCRQESLDAIIIKLFLRMLTKPKIYISPGVGIVKMEQTSDILGMRMLWQLSDYKLEKKEKNLFPNGDRI